MSDVVAEVAERLGRLIQVPSVNPLHAGPRAGVPGEKALAHAVAGWLRDVGAEQVELVETAGDDRPDVIGVFPGTSDRWRCLDVHLDTVGVEHMTVDPFSGHVADGRVWGRGAVDTKASLAVILTVLAELKRTGRRPGANLLVTGTVAEEAGWLLGAVAFREWLESSGIALDELVIAEPTGCAPVYGHKGGLGVELIVRGLAAHSARPDAGRNAIEAAAGLVRALHEEHAALQRRPPTPLGHGTLAVTTIAGGTAGNIIPDTCRLYASRRLVPGEDPRTVFDGLVDLARRASPLPVDAEYTQGMRAFYGSPDNELCRSFAGWSGRAPETIGLGTNAFGYDGLCPQTIVFGPGSIEQAHAAEEWVALSELATAVGVLRQWVLSDPVTVTTPEN